MWKKETEMIKSKKSNAIWNRSEDVSVVGYFCIYFMFFILFFMWCFSPSLQLGSEEYDGIVMLKSPRDGLAIKILVEVQHQNTLTHKQKLTQT